MNWVCQVDPFTQKIIVTPARSIGTYGHKNEHGVLTVYYGNKKLREALYNMVENMKRGF